MTGVLIDGRSLQDGSALRGIGTYARGLLGALAELEGGDHLSVLLAPGAPPPELVRLGVRASPVRIRSLGPRLQPLSDPFVISAAVRRLRPSVYHGLEYAQPLAPGPTPVVITAHDLVPFVLPDLYPWRKRTRLLARRLLRRATAIIAVSEATARDLCRLAAVDRARITVVHSGVSPVYRPAPAAVVDEMRVRHRLTGPYLLAVGTFEPRKRLDRLCDVAVRVRRTHDVTLVIAGAQGNFEAAVAMGLERAGLADHARVLGHVTLDELIALYTGTDCLVFTSEYEGFGLPPLEAMACRAPIALFDNSSLPEVAGPAALMLPDGDAEAMAGAIVRLLDQPSDAAWRRDAGEEWARGFTWSRAARQTLDVYRSVTR